MTTHVLKNGNIVTGSQDGKINIWGNDGKTKIKEWKAHEDIVRSFTNFEEIGFVSCSNDETVKFWTNEGDLLQSMSGHAGFVFDVYEISPGVVASGSDDRSVKIWKDGECVQTISHP